MSDPVTAYAESVVNGTQVAGKLVNLACQRHLRDLEQGKFHWHKVAAQRILDLVSLLRHVEGEWAGQRIELQPWQAFCLGSIAGWQHRDTGYRRYRYGYNECARKQGKTSIAGALSLIFTFLDSEPGSQGYIAATKQDQARLTYNIAKMMVKADASLRHRLKIVSTSVCDLKTNSRLMPLASDANSLDGLSVHFCCLDEIHAHRTRAVYDVIDTAKGARRQPLIWMTTTAGHDRQSLWWDLREYSIKILEGSQEDDSWFAYIATLDDGDDPFDEAVWVKANPNLGVSVKLEELRSMAAKAKKMPAAYNAFLRLHCNVPTEQNEKWLDVALWRDCEQEIDTEALRDEPAYLGIDLAQYIDVTAAVLYFPKSKTVLPFFWLPKESMHRRVERDRVPYDVWAREGHIRLTEGNKVDQETIRKDLNELASKYRIEECLIDPWNAAVMENWLSEDGFKVTRFAQTAGNMSSPCKELEAMLLEQQLRIQPNPVLRWMAGNVSVKINSEGHLKPDREASGEKIDGITGLLMAVGASLRTSSDSSEPTIEFI